jgi:hypothetical protein
MIETVVRYFSFDTDAEDPVSIPVKAIVTCFLVYIKEYNDTKGQANGQTEDIDQRIQLIPNQYPEGNLEETGKHHQIF